MRARRGSRDRGSISVVLLFLVLIVLGGAGLLIRQGISW